MALLSLQERHAAEAMINEVEYIELSDRTDFNDRFHRAARVPGRAMTTLVLACGALAREVLAVVQANRWEHVDVQCLPAKLHLTPGLIPDAVERKLRAVGGDYEHVFVAYGDCGTSGALDRVLAEHGAERLPGAHCYGFFAGNDEWQAMHDDEPGTFYLTDFLVRHFDALVIRALGLDRYPELVSVVFAHYRRLVYLAQTDDSDLVSRAQAAATRLDLEFEYHFTGYGELASSVSRFMEERRAA